MSIYDNLQQEDPKFAELNSTPDEDLLLDRIIRKPLRAARMEYNIDHYNKWITSELPQQIAARPIEFANARDPTKRMLARVVITGVESPTYNCNGKDIPLIPHVAELEERNYMAGVVGYVQTYDPAYPEKPVDESPSGRLFEFPLMTKSKPCPLSKLETEDEYIELLADPRDCYGYFIINGIRRSIPLVERLRHHIMIISPANSRAKKTDTPYMNVKQTVPTPYSTSQSTVMLEPMKNSDLHVARYTISAFKKKLGAREAHIPNSVNVVMMCYLVSYLMGESRDTQQDHKEMRTIFVTEFNRMIPPSRRDKCYLEFLATIADYDRTTLGGTLSELSKILDPERGEVETRLKTILIEDIIPHISASEPAIEKIRTLIMLTTRIIQYKAGFMSATSKNNWAYKNLDTAAKLCGRSIKKHWKGCVASIMSESTSEKKKSFQPILSTAKDLHDRIVRFNLTQFILNDFKNGQDSKDAASHAMGAKKPQGKPKMDMTLVLNTINVVELHSLMTKIVTNMSSKNSLLSVRAVQGSYYNYICATTATDNDTCGITKFLAMSTLITSDEPAEDVINAIMTPETITRRQICRHDYDSKSGYVNPVSINGVMIGYTTKFGYESVINLRRAGKIHRHTGIINTSHGFLEIYTDAGRLIRPVVVVDKSTNRLRIYLDKYKNIWKSMSLLDLLSNGLIEYLDSYEGENKNIVVATTFTELDNYHLKVDVSWKKIKALEEEVRSHDVNITEINSKTNLLDKLWLQYQNAVDYPPTHANLHPVTGYGTTLAMSIFANHCQSCRMSFNDKMFKQANGSIHANPYSHTEGRSLLYATNPTVESIVTDMYNLKGVPGGQTITLAFVADAMNQEDSIIFNRTFLDAGNFRYMRTKKFRVTLSADQKFGRTADSAGKFHMRHINDMGLPDVGAFLGTKDAVIGMYQETQGVGGAIIQIDKSEYLEHDEIGTVRDVVTYRSTKKDKGQSGGADVGITVAVRVDMYMVPQIGDKYTARFAQKVTVSTIRDEVDMPHFADGPMIGVSPDALVHPASLPTRMTSGYIMEPLAARAYASKGRAYDATAHSEYNESNLQKMLLENGYTANGKSRLRYGDGRVTTCEIFTGPIFLQQLYHIAQEKINARAVGQVNKRTRQALASKNNGREKGQKVGEHEREGLLKAGAAFFVQERFSTTSDAYRVVLCTKCSNFAKYEPTAAEGNRFSCPMCGINKEKKCESTFGKIMLPYTFLYMNTLLMSMGIKLSPSVTTVDKYLDDIDKSKLKLKGHTPRDRNNFLDQNRLYDDVDSDEEPDPVDDQEDSDASYEDFDYDD